MVTSGKGTGSQAWGGRARTGAGKESSFYLMERAMAKVPVSPVSQGRKGHRSFPLLLGSEKSIHGKGAAMFSFLARVLTRQVSPASEWIINY